MQSTLESGGGEASSPDLQAMHGDFLPKRIGLKGVQVPFLGELREHVSLRYSPPYKDLEILQILLR